MKIHRQIVATGREWKPCRQCGRKFEDGEILTAVDTESHTGTLYWFCETCTEARFGHLLRQGWPGTWKISRADGSAEEVDWNEAG